MKGQKTLDIRFIAIVVFNEKSCVQRYEFEVFGGFSSLNAPLNICLSIEDEANSEDLLPEKRRTFQNDNFKTLHVQ